MRRLMKSPISANVMAAAALFLAMSGVAAAVTLAPKNSVTSGSIKDGEVRTADVRTGAVTRPKLAPNAVNGGRVANGSLTGADLKDNSVGDADVRNDSLSGADIQDGSISGYDVTESSLGEVPAATLGGIGRSGDPGSCDPEDTTYVACATVSINLPQPARVLLVGGTKALISQGATYAYGSCRVATDDASGPIAGSGVDFDLTGDSWSQHAPLMTVAEYLNPGTYTIGIECNEQSGKIEYPQARVAAVALSAD